MVDSRQKGARAESQARDLFKKYTGLKWERVPGSGALNEKHGLKGDLYVPNEKNIFCVEVKHYAEDQLTSKMITGKSPTFLSWWAQTLRESKQVDRAPMLVFKHNRSKWFIAVWDTKFVESIGSRSFIFNYPGGKVRIMLLEEYLGAVQEYQDWWVRA